MNRIVTRGLGPVPTPITRGYGERVYVRYREVVRLASKLLRTLALRSPWRPAT